MPESPLVVSETDGVALVGFRSQSMLDTVAVNAIGDELYGLVDREKRRAIVLDFANVHFLSSPALSMLLKLRRKADQAGLQVALCQPRPEITRLFQITRLDKLFQFFDTPDAARAHLAGSTGGESSPSK